MQMHIRHETHYRYERPVKYSVQSLHLTPRRDPSQRPELDHHRPRPPPRTSRRPRQYFASPHHRRTPPRNNNHGRGVVETADTEAARTTAPLAPRLSRPHATHRAQRRDSRLRARRPAHLTDPKARAQRLAEAVYNAVRYKTGTSDVQDSAAVAFRSGEGVCQDHAHVYIASARAVGMPARYVSGYLYTGDTGDTSDAASHAWVDVWLGSEIGWQSMDVTHQRPAVRTYCRLAVGRDYLDAAPVRGVRQGGGGEKMEANVLVAESAQTAVTFETTSARRRVIESLAFRLEVQAPPCLTQNEQPHSRATTSGVSSGQSSTKAIFPQ
jgi:transglutaminase-like putative cysteine protease